MSDPDDESSARLSISARPRSLAAPRNRSLSRPSELLARKQQLLSANGASGGDSWTGSAASPLSPDSSGRIHSSRSQTRRASQDLSGDLRAQSVDTKLESLSEMLKDHQQQSEIFSGQNLAKSSQLELDGLPTKSIDDVYIILAKKEKDLQLAAELGKVLLEKNDELSKANERIAEEYSHKLELLEQDKHKLKRRLDQLAAESENRLIELQTDCAILRNQLDEQQQAARQIEKEKSKLIDDLVQQNQRLTSELVEATKSEELLSSQLEQMNERFNVRLSDRQDHVVQLDALKEEIQIVNQRKQDLERRLKLAHSDKQNLQSALEESGDRLLLLENVIAEKDAKTGELAEELNEFRDSSAWLSNELEAMISLNEKLAGTDDNTELRVQLSEESTGTGDNQRLVSESQAKRSQLVEQLRQLRMRNRTRIRASEMILVQRRNQSGESRAKLHNHLRRPNSRASQSTSRNYSPDSSNGLSHEDFDEVESSEAEHQAPTAGYSSDQLAAEVYAMLRRFQSALQVRRESFQQHQASGAKTQQAYGPNSADDSGISGDDGAAEQAQAKEPAQWRRLLTSLQSLIEEMVSSRGERQLQKLHAKLCEETRRRNEQLLALEMVKTEQETRLAALEEKCQLLSGDLENCDKPKEEIVKLAWKARDEAVERKNNAEISLARTRIENMQIASQLMEVVQQKGELSQKLAQFEDDIHYITQDSVKAKFTWEEYAEKLRKSKATSAQEGGGGFGVASTVSGLSRPLAQLLSFSVVGGGGSATGPAPSSTSDNSADGSTKSSAVDSLSQPASLMRNLTSNRFNLRFWQKSNPAATARVEKVTMESTLRPESGAN